jgi:hypothetical protein
VKGGNAVERWDGVLENIQRTDRTPFARNTRGALSAGKTGMDLPAENAYSVIAHLYTGPFIELWAADPPQNPTLREALQPVHDAAHAFTPYESLLPQIDQLLEAVSAARDALSQRGSGDRDAAPTAEQIIADIEMWLKVALLVAGTSHLGPMKVIDDEIAKQTEAARTGLRLPPRHFDFATNQVVHVSTGTSISLAAFAASVDIAIATTWAEAMQPDPSDQPSIMKQFATQLIVTFHTEWDEYYRPALAKALGCDREEIRSEYFADINRMRQDYVHKMRGIARNSAKNKVLEWYSKGDNMIPTPANYVQLLTDFPATELLTPKPIPPEQRQRKPINANADPTLVRQFEEAADRLGVNKNMALDQMITEFLAAHPETEPDN